MNVGSRRRDLNVETGRDQSLHLLGMRDQTHCPHFICQGVERFQSRVQRFVIKRAKSLVDEDGIQFDSTAVLLNHIGQPECQGQ